MTERRHVPAGDQDAHRQLYDGLAGVVVGIARAENLLAGCRILAAFGVQHLGADVAGVSRLPRRGGPEMLTATDSVVELVASRRESAETVPAPAVEGEVLVLPQTGGGHPDRTLHPVAAGLGLRSALLIALPALSSGAVTLELYSRTPGILDDVPDEVAAQVTALAGTTLRELERRTDLEAAIETRGVIGQAQGILMERYGLTGEQAMGYLRRHSQQSQQPIRSLAVELVGRREAESLARAQENRR